MASPGPQSTRRLAALWFADIVGYTALSTENEGAALRLVEQFQRVCRASVNEQGGRVIKFIGDAALAEFANSEAAVRAALALREGFAGSSLEAPALRIGVHVGAIVGADDGDVYGDGVNTASRLQEEAAPGQILVSEDVWRQLRPLGQFSFGSPDRRRLRGLPQALGIYELRHELPAMADRPARLRGGGAALDFITSRRRSAVALAFVVLGATGLWGGRELWVGSGAASLDPVAPELDPARIAVMYFRDRSPDQQLGWLADGLTERLIHELNQVDALDVVPMAGVKPFQGKNVALDTIVNALRAGSLVEGSVTQSGGRVQVTVYLVDGATGSQGDSEIVEQAVGATMPLQDALAQRVAEILRRSLGREIRIRQTRRGTTSEAAYELLLRAKKLQEDVHVMRKTDADAARRGLLQADSILTRVERLDTSWVEPILRRGWVARDLARDQGPLAGVHDPDWTRVALGHAERAVRMRPQEAGAHELLGILKYDLARIEQGEGRRRLLQEAEADLRRAVDLDERRARAWWTLSEMLVEQTRFSEASIFARRALEADAFLENVGSVLYQIFNASAQFGPADEAVTACDEGRRRFPADSDFLVCRLFILASFRQVEPDVDQAWALADSLPDTVGDEFRDQFQALGTMLVAETAARAGLADSARAIMRMARGDGPTPEWLAYNEAHARLLLGEPDAAIALLSRYLTYNTDTVRVARDWWFEELHPDTAFQRIVGQSQ